MLFIFNEEKKIELERQIPRDQIDSLEKTIMSLVTIKQVLKKIGDIKE